MSDLFSGGSSREVFLDIRFYEVLIEMNSENPYCILAKCVITSCTTGKLQFVSQIQEYI